MCLLSVCTSRILLADAAPCCLTCTPGPAVGLNGTYNTHLFAGRAIDLIRVRTCCHAAGRFVAFFFVAQLFLKASASILFLAVLGCQRENIPCNPIRVAVLPLLAQAHAAAQKQQNAPTSHGLFLCVCSCLYHFHFSLPVNHSCVNVNRLALVLPPLLMAHCERMRVGILHGRKRMPHCKCQCTIATTPRPCHNSTVMGVQLEDWV